MSNLLNLLAEDNDLIPYRKSLRKIAGSVTATILLQQMIHRAKKKNWEPFYKFKDKCEHELYKPSDSWTEELGFSISEFDTALKRIGTKITKGAKKSKAYAGDKAKNIIIYWTDANRITWYHVNYNLLNKLTKSIYLEDQESAFTYKDNTSDLPSLTESPTETTTERKNTPPPKIENNSSQFSQKIDVAKAPIDTGNLSQFGIDPLTDVFNQQTIAETTAPNPADQWFEYSDQFIKLFHQKAERYPNQDEKAAISELAGEPGASIELWETSLTECNLHFTGHKLPVSRPIDVYRCGGSWRKWQEKTYGDNGGNGNKPKKTPEPVYNDKGEIVGTI